MRGFKSAMTVVGLALMTAAVVQEMKKPPSLRTWRGRLTFSVPYDFNIPTLQRLREAYWNAEDDRIFTDRILGMGWAINFHALLRKIGWSS